jgi:hypothetical protein
MECKRDSDGRPIDKISLQVMRQQAVKAVGKGEAVVRVRVAFGAISENCGLLVAGSVSGDQNALLAQVIPGRPPEGDSQGNALD